MYHVLYVGAPLYFVQESILDPVALWDAEELGSIVRRAGDHPQAVQKWVGR